MNGFLRKFFNGNKDFFYKRLWDLFIKSFPRVYINTVVYIVHTIHVQFM